MGRGGGMEWFRTLQEKNHRNKENAREKGDKEKKGLNGEEEGGKGKEKEKERKGRWSLEQEKDERAE